MVLLNFCKGLFLFGVHLSNSLAIVLPYSPPNLVCGTGDLAPVNLQAEWRTEERCYDLEGNIYEKGEVIRSCCDCLEYTCMTEERDKCVYYKWIESTSQHHSCCVDCEGVVFPPGEVMSTIHLNDSCSSIKTERCEENSKKGVFVSRSIVPTSCCVNSSGIQPLKSTSLEPEICSTQTCDISPRHSNAFWLVEKEHEGCNCCVYNGSLVPDGWSKVVNSFQNMTCCKGDLQLTFLPHLSECQIQNLTYLIDSSGSMTNSRPIWEPVALELIDLMEVRQVDVMDYTLMDYVTVVKVTETTSSNAVFQAAVEDMAIPGGSIELTFTGLLEALQSSSCHNFIAVFTDAIGDDTDDLTLKSEILFLKNQRKSEIFFMVMPSSPMGPITDITNSRSGGTMEEMEAVFGDIGHVFDITKNKSAVKEVVDLMEASQICTETCPPANANIFGRRIFGSEPIPVPWLTVLKRGQYGNPVSMFSDATFSEYVAGFGDVNKEFWIGLQKLADMTAAGVWKLRVELVDFEENIYIAEFNSFKVDGANERFRLTANGFKNGSSLQDSLSYHSGMSFSAGDKNNDSFIGNCTKPEGWWWHNNCLQSSLFGNNLNAANSTSNGIVWMNDENVPEQDLSFSWPYAEMKIKQVEGPDKEQD